MCENVFGVNVANAPLRKLKKFQFSQLFSFALELKLRTCPIMMYTINESDQTWQATSYSFREALKSLKKMGSVIPTSCLVYVFICIIFYLVPPLFS